MTLNAYETWNFGGWNDNDGVPARSRHERGLRALVGDYSVGNHGAWQPLTLNPPITQHESNSILLLFYSERHASPRMLIL